MELAGAGMRDRQMEITRDVQREKRRPRGRGNGKVTSLR